MAEFTRVAKVSDVPDPGKMMLEIDERLVVLLHVGGEFFCLDDVCTHDGGPLGDGELCGHELACPRHGAKFDVKTGKALTMPATEDTASHEVKVEGEDIFVKIQEVQGGT
jgi:3-phenylpropionate/trans-cinnamate dioxygenase ferredoxin subunit